MVWRLAISPEEGGRVGTLWTDLALLVLELQRLLGLGQHVQAPAAHLNIGEPFLYYRESNRIFFMYI
jgi:hypothetical protein